MVRIVIEGRLSYLAGKGRLPDLLRPGFTLHLLQALPLGTPPLGSQLLLPPAFGGRLREEEVCAKIVLRQLILPLQK